jgi:hypothetical protein
MWLTPKVIGLMISLVSDAYHIAPIKGLQKISQDRHLQSQLPTKGAQLQSSHYSWSRYYYAYLFHRCCVISGILISGGSPAYRNYGLQSLRHAVAQLVYFLNF